MWPHRPHLPESANTTTGAGAKVLKAGKLTLKLNSKSNEIKVIM